MKKLLLLFVLVALAKTQSQNTELVDYLLELHQLTESYYDFMTLVFQETRDLLSYHLRTLSDAGLLEITEGLRIIIAIRNETQVLIDSAAGDEQCLQISIANWQLAVERSGRSISSCADQSFTPINNATDDFHHFVVEESHLAFAVQNVILNGLSEVNLITDEDQFTRFVGDQVDEMYENFTYETIPSLFRHLEDFFRLEATLPIEIHDCVSDATNRLDDEALVLRNTLEFC